MVPKHLEDMDPRREWDRAGMHITNETRRNERKKTFKNKCNNFLMGILHNRVLFLPHLKPASFLLPFSPGFSKEVKLP